MLLVPLPIARWFSCLIGIVPLFGFGFVSGLPNRLEKIGVIAASVLLAIVVAVRAYRFGVVCRDDEILVRGLFRSRTIPLTRIRDITRHPAVKWISPRGRNRWTPITAFLQGANTLMGVAMHNRFMVHQLWTWVNEHVPSDE